MRPDLAHELRQASPKAPAKLRERVRLLAAQAPPPSPPRRPRLTWRRALVAAVPVAAAVAAVVVATRPAQQERLQPLPYQHAAMPAVPPRAGAATAAGGAPRAALVPANTPGRLQRDEATLRLRVPTAAAISAATKQALAIARSLHGYPSYVSVDAGGPGGAAEIRLRVPKTHVDEAVRRLSALGRILGENVQVQDLQASANAKTRLIARLERQLAALRGQKQTRIVQRRILQLTAQIQRLQRQRAATVRQAHYATVELDLSTPPPVRHAPPHHGPLHGLGAAFRWIGVGLVYALAIGTPFALFAVGVWLALRALRRRREAALLSRP